MRVQLGTVHTRTGKISVSPVSAARRRMAGGDRARAAEVLLLLMVEVVLGTSPGEDVLVPICCVESGEDVLVPICCVESILRVKLLLICCCGLSLRTYVHVPTVIVMVAVVMLYVPPVPKGASIICV